MSEIESKNKCLRSINCHNSVAIWRNLPIFDPKTHLPNIKSYGKFEKKKLLIESENEMLTVKCMNGQTLKLKFLNRGYNMIPYTF